VIRAASALGQYTRLNLVSRGLGLLVTVSDKASLQKKICASQRLRIPPTRSNSYGLFFDPLWFKAPLDEMSEVPMKYRARGSSEPPEPHAALPRRFTFP
jgi:hypothetical protein